MKKKTKALLYGFACFAAIYTLIYFLIIEFTGLTGLWRPVTAAVAASLLSPRFQVLVYQNEERIYMKWIFLKNIREVR